MRGAIVTLFSQTANGVVANTVAEQSITAGGVGSLTLPANFLDVGTSLRILGRGVWGTGSGTPTKRWRVRLGPVVILDTGAIQVAKAIVNEPWALEAVLVVRARGATGSVIAAGSVGSATEHLDFAPMTAPVAIDTTKPLALDVTCQWSVASASSIVTCTQFLIWAEQPV